MPPKACECLKGSGKSLWMKCGRRPTFVQEEKKDTVEVHLLDFAGELYGQEIQVHLVQRLREEKKFPNPQALKSQITKDISQARKWISNMKND